jgi:Fe-S cluster biogenesis protein NfuA
MDHLDDFKKDADQVKDGQHLSFVQNKIESQPSLSFESQADPMDTVNHGSSAAMDASVEAAKITIQQVLAELMPYIASHGGNVELVEFKDKIVFIKFYGTCVQCPLSFYTVTYGIERHIKAKIPWIIRVEVVE